MKKKGLSLLLILVLALSLIPMAAQAADAPVVYVTIADSGSIVTGKGDVLMAAVPVTVLDLDGSGVYDVNEALICTHNLYFPGGAEAGYATEETQYGPALSVLWGDDSTMFGYYVNDAMAWSPEDPVADGDRISAFVYKDKEFLSDAYAYFTPATVEGSAAELTLIAFTGYDESWNPIFAPLAGASVTVNGEKSAVTDESGRVSLSFDKAGTYLISAGSESVTLVPPVCTVTVPEAAKPARTHTVQPGDTLWKLARTYLGSGLRWGDIYSANTDTVKNPRLIYPGQVLVIPE